jgi:GTP-binding protein YchF
MGISAGLVGLPNVGKSTLFNALTKSSVPAENYPFCTIEPHIAITKVPDNRLDHLNKIFNSKKLVPAIMQFVDIAGLVEGAASGEGLGNQFLSHIREVDLILHVLRSFDDSTIVKDSEIDPISDYEVIVSELMLKDLESIEKRLAKIENLLKSAKNNPKMFKELQNEKILLKDVQKSMEKGDAETVRKLISEAKVITIPLISAKNFLIIANISEIDIENYDNNQYYQKLVQKFGKDRVIPICAKTEYELSQLDETEAKEMMDLLGLKEKGLDKIIQKSYENLGLISFFTCGPEESHAWPIKKGISIREAAGKIHSDLERGFICAEVYNYKDIAQYLNEKTLKEKGKLRTEGQDYVVQDGDVIHIKFNV